MLNPGLVGRRAKGEVATEADADQGDAFQLEEVEHRGDGLPAFDAVAEAEGEEGDRECQQEADPENPKCSFGQDEFLLGFFCLFFRHTFFNRFWRAVNQLFSVFQTQTGQFANYFNYVDFLRTGFLQNYVKFCFLFSGGGSAGPYDPPLRPVRSRRVPGSRHNP